MELRPIRYAAGGLDFMGYLADGSGGRRVPGILVIHEGGGLTAETRRRTAMLGELGSVAFAMDLFGEPVVDIERARVHMRHLRDNVVDLRARCRAALDVVLGQIGTDPARIAVIGYCIGGAAAIELAETVPTSPASSASIPASSTRLRRRMTMRSRRGS